MIISIDETGDFDQASDKRHIFIAAFIQSENGRLRKKIEQLASWERCLPESARNKNGEVKGSLLNKFHLRSFVESIILQSPQIRTSFVSIVPKQNPPEIIKKYQEFEIRQIEYSLELFKEADSKKKNINFLIGYFKWLKKKSISEFLKMLCLKNTLRNALDNIMIYCIVNDKTEEILNLNYKIDKDFLTEEDIFWGEYLRRSIQESSKMKPFPILDTWKKDHPFRKKYMTANGGREGININQLFKDNLRFVDSENSHEVRIADIIGIIMNRYWNKGELEDEYRILTKMSPVRDGHIQLLFEDFDADALFEKYKIQSY